MSLAKRNDGCLECRTRRVRCDKTEPECFKCRKKGIKCSGQGVEWRFSDHMKTGSSAATKPQQQPRKSPKRLKWVNAPESSPDSRASSSSPPTMTLALRNTTPQMSVPQLMTPVYEIPPHHRMLFDHFSNSIAPSMVIRDFVGNGYREILLPLACRDDVLSHAVSVISAFHLSQKMPSLRTAAEQGQQLVLSKLRQDSLQLQPNHLFNLATWATILVLIVGDTITGSNNFVYLLELLSRLAEKLEDDGSLSESTRTFVREQTHLFQMFGFPLISEQKGVETIDKLMMAPDNFDFMLVHVLPSTDSTHRAFLGTMTNVMKQALTIYKRRALRNVTDQESIEAVERLRRLVASFDPQTEGCHALVWAYFAAAAESRLPEHREFFSERLRGLFSCTEFGTIPIALSTLDYIWANQDRLSWTEIMTRQKPLLII